METEIAVLMAILGVAFSLFELRWGIDGLMKLRAIKRYRASKKASQDLEFFVCFSDDEVVKLKKFASSSDTSGIINYLDKAKRIAA